MSYYSPILSYTYHMCTGSLGTGTWRCGRGIVRCTRCLMERCMGAKSWGMSD